MVQPFSQQLVMFAVSGRRLAFPADAVAELVLEPALESPPEMPTVLAGLFNLRGRVVPVVRPDRLLGLPPPAAGLFRTLLVINGRDGPWALLAERALAVVEADAAEAAPADVSFDDCVVAMHAAPEGAVPVLSPDRLVRRREAQVLA
ncbi:MAG TPA: chemotaxis protein CheW, partial [Magnetospirillum sp.]|nr:chemotaxis protein CheW [Magnetospirillum sp.]